MPLIACPGCGHKISSLARFCPKCNYSKKSLEQSKIPADISIQMQETPAKEVPFQHVPFNSRIFSGEELLQNEFRPSLDEKILFEGKCFLVRGAFRIIDVYARLTSKRYVLCEVTGKNILFQLGCDGIASVTEGRHVFSKKIVITSISGDVLQVKGLPHQKWFDALHELVSSAGVPIGIKPIQPEPVKKGMEWYYNEAGDNIGPVSEKVMVQLIRNNHTVFRNTMVWNSGLSEWKSAEQTILTIYFGESTGLFGNMGPGGDEQEVATAGFFSRASLKFRKYF